MIARVGDVRGGGGHEYAIKVFTNQFTNYIRLVAYGLRVGCTRS
jgi:hypothetical protein